MDNFEWELRGFKYKGYDFVLSTGGASMIFNNGASSFSDRDAGPFTAKFLKNAKQEELDTIAEKVLNKHQENEKLFNGKTINESWNGIV